MRNWESSERVASEMDAEKAYLENQGFIEACARKLCGTFHCEHLLEDLISVGTLAFLEHLPDYDETAGTKLTTYLYPFINGDMRREIEASLGPLHIPKRRLRKKARLRASHWRNCGSRSSLKAEE